MACAALIPCRPRAARSRSEGLLAGRCRPTTDEAFAMSRPGPPGRLFCWSAVVGQTLFRTRLWTHDRLVAGLDHAALRLKLLSEKLSGLRRRHQSFEDFAAGSDGGNAFRGHLLEEPEELAIGDGLLEDRREKF